MAINLWVIDLCSNSINPPILNTRAEKLPIMLIEKYSQPKTKGERIGVSEIKNLEISSLILKYFTNNTLLKQMSANEVKTFNIGRI